MPWLQLRISATKKNTEQLSDVLMEAGALAVTLQDAGDQPLLEPGPGETPIWSETIVIGLFNADEDMNAVMRFVESKTGSAFQYKLDPLEDKDWERAWMDNYHPMSFGDRLWIVPSWTPPPDPDAVNILLDPGLAFGTGTHPTTALCLEWLDQHDIYGKEIIDYGCGSGILAIAAALLGAKHVWAIDHDPQALTATLANAEKNNISEKISVGRPHELPEIQADIILANILAGPLMSLAGHLAKHTKTGGNIILSGLLVAQAQEVTDQYRTHYSMHNPVQKEGWVRLDGKKM